MSTARAGSVSVSSYTNTIFNQSARVLSLDSFLNNIIHSFVRSFNANESEYSKTDESGNIYESGKISSSVNLVSFIHSFFYGFVDYLFIYLLIYLLIYLFIGLF